MTAVATLTRDTWYAVAQRTESGFAIDAYTAAGVTDALDFFDAAYAPERVESIQALYALMAERDYGSAPIYQGGRSWVWVREGTR